MSDMLTYPWPRPPASGQWREVAPGIRWLRLPLPFALDHINVWLLADGDGWTLVDTGIGLPDVQPVWERLFESAMEGRPLQRILVTHYHPDHVGQAGWLSERFGAPVWMPEQEYAFARQLVEASDEAVGERTVGLFRVHGLDEGRLEKLRRRGNTYRRLVGPLPDSVRFLRGGDTVVIGDRTWQVIIGRGHSPEHACLVSTDGDLMISGDQVLPRISTNVSVRAGHEHLDPLGDYLESLRRIAKLPPAIRILPSHGLVFEGLHQRLEALARHHEAHLQRLMKACRTPHSAADVLPLMFRRELDEHAILFAMGESIAHLHHLHCQGRLKRLDGTPYQYVAP